jgi:hypothetical protein
VAWGQNQIQASVSRLGGFVVKTFDTSIFHQFLGGERFMMGSLVLLTRPVDRTMAKSDSLWRAAFGIGTFWKTSSRPTRSDSIIGQLPAALATLLTQTRNGLALFPLLKTR